MGSQCVPAPLGAVARAAAVLCAAVLAATSMVPVASAQSALGLVGPPPEEQCAFWRSGSGQVTDTASFHPRGFAPNGTHNILLARDASYTVSVPDATAVDVGSLRIRIYPTRRVALTLGPGSRLTVGATGVERKECESRGPKRPGMPQVVPASIQAYSATITFQQPTDSGSSELEQYRVLLLQDGADTQWVGITMVDRDVNEALNCDAFTEAAASCGPAASHFHPDVQATVSVFPGGVVSVTIAQLRPATTYRVQVRAANAEYLSAWSPESDDFTTAATAADFINYANYRIDSVVERAPTNPPRRLSGANGVLVIEWLEPNLNGAAFAAADEDDVQLYHLAQFEMYPVERSVEGDESSPLRSVASPHVCATGGSFVAGGMGGGAAAAHLRALQYDTNTTDRNTWLKEAFAADPASDEHMALAQLGCMDDPNLLITGNSRVQLAGSLVGTSLYFYRVRANSTHGWGPWSDLSTEMPTTALPPAAPVVDTVEAHLVAPTDDDTSATLQFFSSSADNGSPVEYYYVALGLPGVDADTDMGCVPSDPNACADFPYLDCIPADPHDPSAGDTCAIRMQRSGNANLYSKAFHGLPPGVSIDFIVSAWNAAGESNAQRRTLRTPAVRPAVPEDVSSTLLARCPGGDPGDRCNYPIDEQAFTFSAAAVDERGASISKWTVAVQTGGAGMAPVGESSTAVCCTAGGSVPSGCSNAVGCQSHYDVTEVSDVGGVVSGVVDATSRVPEGNGVAHTMLPGSWYRIALRASNNVGDSDWSLFGPWHRSGTGMVIGPAVSLEAPADSPRQLVLHLSGAANVGMPDETATTAQLQYHYRVVDGGTGKNLLGATASHFSAHACTGAAPVGGTCILTGLDPETAYDVQVFATNSAHRDVSLEHTSVVYASAVTSEDLPPRAVALSIDATPGAATVTWTPHPDDFNSTGFWYTWELTNTAANPARVVASGSTAAYELPRSLSVDGLSNTGSYTVAVTPWSVVGLGATTSTVVSLPPAVGMASGSGDGARQLPSNVRPSDMGVTTAQIQWLAPGNTGGAAYSDLCYHVYYADTEAIEDAGADGDDAASAEAAAVAVKVLPFGIDPDADESAWCVPHDVVRSAAGYAGESACPDRGSDPAAWRCPVAYTLRGLLPLHQYHFYVAVSNGHETPGDLTRAALQARWVVASTKALTDAGDAPSAPRGLTAAASASCVDTLVMEPLDDGGQTVTAFCVFTRSVAGSSSAAAPRPSLATRTLVKANNFTCLNEADAAENFGDSHEFALLAVHAVSPAGAASDSETGSGSRAGTAVPYTATATAEGRVYGMRSCGLDAATTYEFAVVAWSGPLDERVTSRSSAPAVATNTTAPAQPPARPSFLQIHSNASSPVFLDPSDAIVVQGGAASGRVPVAIPEDDGGAAVHKFSVTVKRASGDAGFDVVYSPATRQWHLCLLGCDPGDAVVTTMPVLFVDAATGSPHIPVRGLPANTNTLVHVVAVTADGASPVSPVTIATTEPASPGCVRNLRADQLPLDDGPGLQLRWLDPLDNGGQAPTHYMVQVREAGGAWHAVACLATGPEQDATLASTLGAAGDVEYTYSVPRLRSLSTYDVRVRAGNDLTDSLCAHLAGEDGAAISNATQQCAVSALTVACAVDAFGVPIGDECWQHTRRTGLAAPSQPPVPRPLDEMVVRRRAVRVAWSPPEYDGGSAVTNYTLERLQCETCVPILVGSVRPDQADASTGVLSVGDANAAMQGATQYLYRITVFTEQFPGAGQGVSAPPVAITTADDCPPGTTETPGDLWGACRPCPIGEYQLEPGQFACLPCPPGSFASEEGLAECVPCPRGFAMPGEGAEQCAPCEPGSFSSADGAETCAPCEQTAETQSYSLGQAVACSPCPEGTRCDGGVLQVLQGKFWKHAGTALNDSYITSSTVFYDCPQPQRCDASLDGYTYPDPALRTILVHDALSGALVDHTCLDNSEGVLCAVCRDGFAEVGELCVECPSGALNGLVIVGLLAVVSVGSTVWIRRQMTKPSAVSAVGRTALSWLQMLSLLGAFRIKGPEFVQSVMTSSATVADGISVDSLPVRCATKFDFADRFWATMLLPVFAIAIPVLVALVWGALHGRFRRGVALRGNTSRASPAPAALGPGGNKGTTRLQHTPSGFGNLPLRTRLMYMAGCAMTVLLVLVHKPVSTAIMRAFDCRSDQILGHTYLRSDMAVRCDTPEHAALQGAASVFGLLYVVGIPATGAAWLVKNRDRLHVPVFERHFQFLFAGYRRERYLWELAVVARKIIVAAIAIFVTDSFQQVYVGSCFIMAFLVLHLLNQPFEDPRLNNLETLSLTSSYITQMGSILYWSRALASDEDASERLSTDDDSAAAGVLVTVVLLAVNLATFAIFIVAGVQIKRTEKAAERSATARAARKHAGRRAGGGDHTADVGGIELEAVEDSLRGKGGGGKTRRVSLNPLSPTNIGIGAAGADGFAQLNSPPRGEARGDGSFVVTSPLQGLSAAGIGTGGDGSFASAANPMYAGGGGGGGGAAAASKHSPTPTKKAFREVTAGKPPGGQKEARRR